MAIIKWKGRVYSFTVAWPLILVTLVLIVVLSIPLVRAIREFVAR